MKIRPATAEDTTKLIELCAEFYEASGFSEHIPYDPDSMEKLFNGLRLNGNIVLVADEDGALVGVLAAHLTPLYFNQNYNVAHELFWYVKLEVRSKGAGIRLLREYEETSKRMGASFAFVTSLEHLETDRVETIYRAHHYEPMERVFIGRLS